jgi:DNA-binding LacI/PurR family transcriptional regulator
MPSNLEGIEEVVSSLPENDVVILDQTRDSFSLYPAIYQNFFNTMYDALLQSKQRLAKYNNIVLVFPGNKEPLGMKIGFEKYCSDFHLEYDVIDSFNKIQPQKGTVYIMPDDRDLVDVVEKSKSQKLAIGKEVGIISYNDTPLKKVVANGITTISTDFAAMGAELAQMLLQNKKLKIENPSRLILRHSF